MLQLNQLRSTAVNTEPYPYFYLARSVGSEHIQSLITDFPTLEKGGSFNIDDLEMSENFRHFVEQFDSDEFRRIIGEKFSVDVMDKPMMATLRGFSRAKDGRIHTDSRTKLVTILVYLNEGWEAQAGRLRILRGGSDMDDFAEELSPGPGAMVAFKVTDNCWHGYPSFEGRRQSIQINFLTGGGARAKHRFFHRLSARLKSLLR
ncbi:2OG-Fe(II) oxygenase [Microbulbifer taiwanensis]|uniref:2OG-Fe(II) oxygenase n=1 Tax=Microbulbifer taiwanensis TaxID=986746 RepID=A0ABW1YLI3_9GAMM|nr:2OG-Fe(II) oxygenase [Microbulbifer taiwanensis]